MYKKVLIVISIFTMCATSYALGYATGGSNMGYYYPSFSSYISYDPTYEELGRYVICFYCRCSRRLYRQQKQPQIP